MSDLRHDAVQLPGTSRYVSRRVVVLLGVVMLLIPAGVVALVIASFSGSLGSYVTVDAELPIGANAPQIDSPVEYRDVTVGTVSSEGRTIGRQVIVVLHLEPSENLRHSLHGPRHGGASLDIRQPVRGSTAAGSSVAGSPDSR